MLPLLLNEIVGLVGVVVAVKLRDCKVRTKYYNVVILSFSVLPGFIFAPTTLRANDHY